MAGAGMAVMLLTALYSLLLSEGLLRPAKNRVAFLAGLEDTGAADALSPEGQPNTGAPVIEQEGGNDR